MKRFRRRSLKNILWLGPALVLVSVFVYFPIVSNFYYSFFEWSAFAPTPKFVGIGNYRRAIHDSVFWTALLNNLKYAAVSLIVQVLFALVLAAILERFVGRRFSGALRVIYFIPATISITVGGLLFTFIYDPNIGLVDRVLQFFGAAPLQHAWLGEPGTAIWAIIALSQWMSFGYTTMLFVVAIQKIPEELNEAAALDGVGPVRGFFHITVPMVREMTALNTVIVLTGSFVVFNEVQVMTAGGPNNSSQVLGTLLYYNAFQADRMGYAAAIGCIIFVLSFSAGLFQIVNAGRKRVEA